MKLIPSRLEEAVPFRNSPHPYLRQWDRVACEAAIAAQILYMGGKLRVPFDTAEFDKRLKRKPGEPIASMEGMRLIAQSLPVTITAYGTNPLEDFANPVKVREALHGFGYPKEEIAGYINGPLFKMKKQQVRDAQLLHRQLGDRYRDVICQNSSTYVSGFLRQGAVVLASLQTSASSTHCALLFSPRESDAADVLLYDPAKGLSHEKLASLMARDLLRFDDLGFTAYTLD